MRGQGTLQPPEGTAPPFAPAGVPDSLEWAQSLRPASCCQNDKTLWVGVSQINWGREGAAGAKAWGHHLHLTVF